MKPVEIPELPGAGALLIWRAPRLTGATHHPGDLDRLRACGVSVVVCLLEEDELRRYGSSLQARQHATETAGMVHISSPIEDFRAPTIDQFETLQADICTHMADGASVLVHCMAGLGRAGTIAAGVLICAGMKAPDAMQLVRWVRPGAIQSQEQEDFLAALRGGIRRSRT